LKETNMAAPSKVQITVASVTGHCAAGHTVGQSWVVEALTPENMCIGAFASLIPHFRVLRFGGEFPWEEDKDTAHIACPDPKNPVVFELRRLRE